MSEHGSAISPELEIEAQSEPDVARGVDSLLKLASRPTAIFGYQDSLAALVYKYLNRAGVRIPSQMSVVGFDDLELATYLLPPLTTVGTHIEPLCHGFLRILLDRIKRTSSSEAPEHLIVVPHVIVRDSCAPPQSTLTTSP